MSEKLKSCPFCKNKPFKRTKLKPIDIGQPYEWYFIKCSKYLCGIVGPWRKTKEEAIKAWNRRFNE